VTHTHTSAAEGRSQDLRTPKPLFLQLDAEFHFTLDACASEDNHLVERYFTYEIDALQQRWDGVVFVNPPYNRCDAFVRKGEREAWHGSTVVMLVPVRADTAWWHDCVLPAQVDGRCEIRWMRGRVKFGRGDAVMDRKVWTSAPFATCILVFRPKKAAA
jgi:phage N-6-adenine-methyltransferase